MCYGLNFKNIIEVLKRKFSACQASSVEPFLFLWVKKATIKEPIIDCINQNGVPTTACEGQQGEVEPQHSCSLCCWQVKKLLYVWKRAAEPLEIPQDFFSPVAPKELPGKRLPWKILNCSRTEVLECNSPPMVPTHCPFEEHGKLSQ